MPKINKNRLLLLSLGVVLTLLIMFFISDLGTRFRKGTTPSYQLPSSNIPRYITEKLPITFDLEESDFIFPTEIPLVEINRKYLSLDFSSSLANKLNMTAEMQRFRDKLEGVKYIWTNDQKSLVITPKNSHVFYYLNFEVPEIDNSIDPEELKPQVYNFLKNNFGYTEENLKIDAINYFIVTPHIEYLQNVNIWESANLYQYNISYRVSDYRILTNSPSKSIISLQILPNGEIFNVEAILLDTFTESDVKVTLKNYNDVKNSIEESSLIEISQKYINLSDLDVNEVIEINLNEIELVYLINSNIIKTLPPVYLISGEIIFRDLSRNTVNFYLSAVK
jgi:hypothetical protein